VSASWPATLDPDRYTVGAFYVGEVRHDSPQLAGPAPLGHIKTTVIRQDGMYLLHEPHVFYPPIHLGIDRASSSVVSIETVEGVGPIAYWGYCDRYRQLASDRLPTLGEVKAAASGARCDVCGEPAAVFLLCTLTETNKKGEIRRLTANGNWRVFQSWRCEEHAAAARQAHRSLRIDAAQLKAVAVA
jgi:hypothetical protein